MAAVIEAVDGLAHFLYCPTMAGRRHARARWHHRIHLLPAAVLDRVCDRYDRWLLQDVSG